MADDGILAGSIDLDGARRRVSYPTVEARTGLVVEHRGSGVVGSIESFVEGRVVLRDRHGHVRPLRPMPGGFLLEGRPCTLVTPSHRPQGASLTASGSVAAASRPARGARASRILVEGIHDAELVEKVWGDDLRDVGVVVERLDGMGDLAAVVRDLGPGPGRRLGVLLDHLVDGSKESRAAAEVRHPQVLVTGTAFVDVWAAIRPRAAGIEAWPVVPRGVPWKAGVLDALGVSDHPGTFWRQLLGRVSSYRDLEPDLVGAVEQLIDFVTDDAAWTRPAAGPHR
ncbi:MAG: DUF3097 family protein [Acidimicrobiales bacterium]|nr:DUF3097 family protein [Acidimicrobiales bacterium]